jgi:hypothetical protein
MLPVWIEVHVDDVALAEARGGAVPERWADTAAVLDALARRAEDAGGRLSFRVRERFAELDRRGFLAGLVRRGHEVGWHAHGKRLRAARDAVVAAGGSAAIAAPGLVQSGERGGLALLEEARALGATRVTDRVEARLFAYQGWLAWEPIAGLVSLDVSVSPFDWGVLARRGAQVVPGVLDPAALQLRITTQERLVVPPGATAFFGATFHEHDVLDARGRARGLDGLARLFDTLGPRLVPSARLPWTPPPPPAAEPRRARLLAPVRRIGLSVGRRLSPPPTERRVRVGNHDVKARRTGPGAPEVVLVLVHGGGSGIAQGLRFCGLTDAALTEVGIASWCFDRSGGAQAPGGATDVADTRAVLQLALAEGRPTALVTWSAGVVPALRAAVSLDDPRLVLLVDAEGPSDRFSLVPPGRPEHELAKLDPADDAAWEGREALAYIGRFPGRYLRLQAARDHVHGRMDWHARRMVAAARARPSGQGRLNGAGEILPGALEAHGAAILGWIREELGV